jgi:hypothetical protein
MKVNLTITTAPGHWSAPPDRRLARLLKTMLRGYGWRCVSAVELPEQEPPDAQRPQKDRR